MRLSRPLAVAAVTVLLAAGYSGLWYHAEGLIEDGVRSWIAEARRHGNDVRFSSLSFDGFPFAVTATATDVRIVRPDGLVWESGTVSATAHPWSWWRIGVDLPGGQRLALADAPELAAAAQSGEGELRIEGGRVVGAEMTLDSVAAALPGLADLVSAETMTGSWAENTPEGGGMPVVTAQLTLDTVTLPQAPVPDLGTRVDQARLEVTVSGPLPTRIAAPDLAAWRDGGGLVAIDLLTLDWGALSVEGTGTLALDEDLQPNGSLTADVSGFLETVDALVAAGHLEARPATFAKAGLSLLAGPPREDGRTVLTAPIALEDRTLAVGPLTIAALPRIDWPPRPVAIGE